MARRSRFPGRARRLTAWSLGPNTDSGSGDGQQQSVSVTGAQLAATGVVPTLEGLTIVRVRGYCSFRMGVRTADGDGFIGALGIGVFPINAFLAGVASLVNPLTENDDEVWLWHTFFNTQGTITTVTGNRGTDFQPMQIDSRSMRKWPDDSTICAVLGVIEIGTAVLGWTVNSRILVKLP